MARLGIPFIAIASIAFGARSAHADVRVERAAAASACPDSASFAARVGAEAKNARAVTVRFDRTSKGYRSFVATADGKQRTLSDDSASCEGLTEATLLAVRLALDIEDAPAPDPRPDPAPAAPAPAAPVPAVAVAAEPSAEAPPAHAPHTSAIGGEIMAGGIVALGIGTPLAPGFRGGAALTLGAGRWSIGVTGVVLPSQTRDVGNGQVDVGVFGGGIEGCGRARLSPVLLALCGRAEVLRLSGASHGFARNEDQARPLFAGTVLGRGQTRIAGPVAMFLEIGAVIPVIRERFAIDGVGLVYDTPPIGGSGGIGALVDFE